MGHGALARGIRAAGGAGHRVLAEGIKLLGQDASGGACGAKPPRKCDFLSEVFLTSLQISSEGVHSLLLTLDWASPTASFFFFATSASETSSVTGLEQKKAMLQPLSLCLALERSWKTDGHSITQNRVGTSFATARPPCASNLKLQSS